VENPGIPTKMQEHRENTAKAVNIPQIDKAETKKIGGELIDRFKNELNPLLEEFLPATGNLDEWLAFECAYEECPDRIRRHIMKTIDGDEKRLCGTRMMNPNTFTEMAG
jgi:cell fate (sporulation/competence/biofilm development) regulator YmcA (YheA/YmcA/DUF963 family)